MSPHNIKSVTGRYYSIWQNYFIAAFLSLPCCQGNNMSKCTVTCIKCCHFGPSWTYLNRIKTINCYVSKRKKCQRVTRMKTGPFGNGNYAVMRRHCPERERVGKQREREREKTAAERDKQLCFNGGVKNYGSTKDKGRQYRV